MSLQALSKGNAAVVLGAENLLSWNQPWDPLTGQFEAAPGDRDNLIRSAVKPGADRLALALQRHEASLEIASAGQGLNWAASATQGHSSRLIREDLTTLGSGWLGTAPLGTAPEIVRATPTENVSHQRACACFACRGINNSSLLSAAGTTAPTGDFRVDALLSGARLGTSGGAEVTFSFVNGLTASSYQGRFGEVVSELSDTIKTSVRTILKSYIEPLVGLTFTEVTEASGTYGQMRLMFSDTGGEDAYAYAFYPEADDAYNQPEVNSLASDIHLSDRYRDPAFDPRNNFASGPGSHGFTTLIHEIGHALGLKHPGNYDSGTGSAAAPYLPSSLDNLHNTVMTYNLAGSSPTTLMPFDIAALQQMYGAKSVNAGKTTYAFTSTHAFSTGGKTWGGASPQRLTLVDSDGVDTLTLSALPATSTGYYIDLRSGGVIADQSDLNTVTGNASKGTRFSLDTTIERVVNSSSDDTIVANGAANVFGGYGLDLATGNDTIEGADSRDRLDLSAFAAASVEQTKADSDLVLDLGAERSITLKDYYAVSASDRIALQFAKVPAPALTIAATDARLEESNADTTPFTFTVTRSGNLDGATTVNWAVSGTGDNPANASDFASDALPSGTVSFAAQETKQVVAVNVRGDLAVEADETFTVTLSNPTAGATLTTASATGTILNDDAQSTFDNRQAIAIRDRGASHPYPSEIEVSALPGPLSDMQVTLKAIDHSWPDDIDVLLVGPTGAKTLLLSDVGGASDIANVTLSFDAAATASLPDSTRLLSGTYRPTNVGDGDRFTDPAPPGPYDADLSVFKGTDPNGTWRLYVADDTGFDQGAIAAGWSLAITTNPLTPTAADSLNAIQPTADFITAQANTTWG